MYDLGDMGDLRLSGGARGLVALLTPGATALAVYTPWDFDTLRQDRAGTIPVTAAGQVVGQMRDVSGFGNHATAIADANRMQVAEGSGLRWIAFDGVAGVYSTPTINPGAADKVQVFAAIRKLSDAAVGFLLEYSPSIDVNNGAFRVLAPHSAVPGYQFASRGTATAFAQVSSGYAAPITNVLTGVGDIAADTAILRANGTQVASSAVDQGIGAFLSYQAFIGSRGGLNSFFNGLLYALVVRWGTTNLSAAQIAQVERLLAPRAGLAF